MADNQIKESASTPVDRKHQRSLNLVDEVDGLGEEVRVLALNLAIYLAKVKSQTQSDRLNRMEPDFIRLVNGTVKVVQEMTMILNAARNMERMIYDVPSGQITQDRLEMRLQAIVAQCTDIMQSLSGTKELKA